MILILFSLQVLKVSALENKGMQDIWTAILEFDRKMKVQSTL